MGKKVQLKENFIEGSNFYRIDDVIDEDILPERLRNSSVIKTPGPPREPDFEEIPVDEEEQEPPEAPPPPRKR